MAKLKGLGRGLDALLAPAEPAAETLITVKPAAIRPGRYQPRQHFDEQAMQELADSIRAQGLIQPVVVREISAGQYELIAGERRWRACQLAGIDTMPAVLREVGDEAVLAMALIENIQRQELDPIEEARGLKRLIEEFSLTHEAAAQAVGRSRSAVSNLLRLLALPEPLQDMLHRGELEMGHARALLPLPVTRQLELAQQVSNQGLSVREVEKRAAQPEAPQARSARSVDPDVARLAETLSEQLGTNVEIRPAGRRGGKLVLAYADLDQLDDLLGKLRA